MSTAEFPPRAARSAQGQRQARLARAVLLADRGDTAGALALVRGVLEEDPHSGPALALLDRLDKPSPPPASEPPAPRRSDGGSWAQFEHRMRIRRETTCVSAMRQAMDAGDFGTALARARELAQIDPAWNEVRLLVEEEARAAARPQPAARPAGHAVASRPRHVATVAPGPRTTLRPPRRRALAAALVVVLLALAATGGWLAVRLLRPDATPLTAHGGPVTTPPAEVEVPNLPPIGAPAASAPEPDVLAPQTHQADAAAPRVADKEKLVTEDRLPRASSATDPPESPADGRVAKPVGPPLSQQLPLTPPASQQSRATSPAPPQSPETQPPSRPANASTLPAPAGSAPTGTSGTGTSDFSKPPDVRVDSGGVQAIPLPPTQPEAPPPATGSTTDPRSLDPPASAPAPTAAPAAASADADDRRAIGTVLAAFERGYTSRDAGAVKRVWPRVDAHALNSAFAQLESQRVAFTGCNLDLRGLHATAICRGAATYVPRVGSGNPVTLQRTWQFALRKFGENWLIDAVATR